MKTIYCDVHGVVANFIKSTGQAFNLEMFYETYLNRMDEYDRLHNTKMD